AAEEGELALRHPVHLQAQQLRVAPGEGTIVTHEFSNRVTHEGSRETRDDAAYAGYCTAGTARGPTGAPCGAAAFAIAAVFAGCTMEGMSRKQSSPPAPLPRWYRGADIPMRLIRHFARQVAE